MMENELIAPEAYNMVMEIEKFAEKEDKLALVYMDQSNARKELTYKQLMLNVNKTGNVLLDAGLKKGDKVLVMVPRIIEAYEVYLAALKTGIIIVPSSEMLTTGDLQYRVTHGEIDGVISYHAFNEVFKGIKEYDELIKFSIGKQIPGWHYLDQLKEEASDALDILAISKDDIAFLPYTSGTTGNPKAVVHTHSWGYAHLRTVAANWLGISEDDKVWATAAPGWQKWVWSPLVATLGSGATGFIYNGKFNAEVYLNLLEKEAINVLCCTPTEYRIMAKSPKLQSVNLQKLHSAVSAGEPLNRKVIEVFQDQFGINVRDGYGQTENTLLLGIMKDMEVKPGSMGKATPGNDVQIVNKEGLPAAVGEIGDIAVNVNCPALFKEYYKDEAKTKQAVRGNYYITGDRATRMRTAIFGSRVVMTISLFHPDTQLDHLKWRMLVKHPAVQECSSQQP